MLPVVIPIPDRDFDPTEVAVTWSVLAAAGVPVVFATPEGKEAAADELMLTGEGLDPWGCIWGLKKIVVLGLFLRANRAARVAYRAMRAQPEFREPVRYDSLRPEQFSGLVLPGGHRARGMRVYLEDPTLQQFVTAFFASDKPVGAICHGVVLAARSKVHGSSRSVLYGRKTTALTWALEKKAWMTTRFFGRFWDPHYYRTYLERADEAAGAQSVQAEVGRSLASVDDFLDVPADSPLHFRKASGLFRDSVKDDRAAFVVVDRNYVSARWPGDVHTFARAFAELLTPGD